MTPLDRNRVGINFTIDEGSAATIKRINLVGVTAFRESTLKDEFALSEGGWFSWFTKDDHYSKQKLTADLETLRPITSIAATWNSMSSRRRFPSRRTRRISSSPSR